jgi:hypothetical protein
MAWAQAGITPTQEVLEPIMRSLHDLPPEGSTEGAREVAQLAAWRAAQEFAFEPVMAALTKLRDRTWNPDQPFMLTDSVRFSWKTAPIRKYASFDDFYCRELESTWGKWSDLQRDWADVVRGKKTVKQVEDRVRQAQTLARSPKQLAEPNVNQIDGSPYKTNIRGYGTSAEYRVAKLKRDHAAVADRLAAGEFKSVAQAERETWPALDALRWVWNHDDDLRRAWRRASYDERAAFLREITAS